MIEKTSSYHAMGALALLLLISLAYADSTIISDFSKEGESVYVADSELKFKFTPEHINCYPYGSNGNFVSVCSFTIEFTDYSEDEVCLDLNTIDLNFSKADYPVSITNYGVIEDSHYICIKEEEVYDSATGHSSMVCVEEEKVVDKSYIKGDEYCNKDHTRTLSGEFMAPYGSSGKFDISFEYNGKTYFIDPTWTSDNASFNGAFVQSYLLGEFIQINNSFTYGNYTSEVFDSGVSNVTWNNISWVPGMYYGLELPNSKATNPFPDSIDMAENNILIHMDAASGNPQDISGGNNHAVATNLTYSQPGVFDYSIYFNRSLNSRGVIGRDSSFESAEYTYSVWIYPYTLPENSVIFAKDYASVAAPYYSNQLRTSSAKLFYGTNDDGVFTSTVTVGNVLVTNSWQHIVVSRNSSEVTIYRNGIEVDDLALSATTLYYDTPLIIGDTNLFPDYNFDGLIDEFAYWNRSLSSLEVQNLYTEGFADLNISYRSCNDSECSGESWSSSYITTPQSLSVDNNRYFQWKVIFGTDSTGTTFLPKLYNVSIDYTEETPSDSCTWAEDEDWIINISDNCTLNEATDLTNAYNLIFVGDDGYAKINTTISAGEIHYTPDDFNGGFMIEVLSGGNLEVIK